jgi:hypothetical protein
MTPENFKFLVDFAQEEIKKQDTNWRKAVSVVEGILIM